MKNENAGRPFLMLKALIVNNHRFRKPTLGIFTGDYARDMAEHYNFLPGAVRYVLMRQAITPLSPTLDVPGLG